MRISDWSSDVCSSDLWRLFVLVGRGQPQPHLERLLLRAGPSPEHRARLAREEAQRRPGAGGRGRAQLDRNRSMAIRACAAQQDCNRRPRRPVCSAPRPEVEHVQARSEEHTSELQSLMRISYAVFCLKKKKKTKP